MEPQVLIDALVELAGYEEELSAANAVLERWRRRDVHLHALADELSDDSDEATAAIQRAATRARRRAADLRDLEAALTARRDQLVGVTDRRQHKALQLEISALERRIDELETSVLEALDESERRELAAGAAKRDEERQRDRSRGELDELAPRAKQATAAKDELEEEILRLTALLPTQVGRHVARLRSQGGPAAVRVESGACGGCFAQLPPQLGIDAARGTGLVRCPACARYVVRHAWR